jgi:hypothetical protein
MIRPFRSPSLGAFRHLPPWCALLAAKPAPHFQPRASNSCPNPTHTTTTSILSSRFLTPLPLPEAFLITPTPFNLHNCLPTGGFLQTAVSDAPRTTSPNLPAFLQWGASDTGLAFLDSA